jgi:hypothetical protein
MGQSSYTYAIQQHTRRSTVVLIVVEYSLLGSGIARLYPATLAGDVRAEGTVLNLSVRPAVTSLTSRFLAWSVLRSTRQLG